MLLHWEQPPIRRVDSFFSQYSSCLEECGISCSIAILNALDVAHGQENDQSEHFVFLYFLLLCYLGALGRLVP